MGWKENGQLFRKRGEREARTATVVQLKKDQFSTKNFSTIKEVYKLKRTQEGRVREGRKESG